MPNPTPFLHFVLFWLPARAHDFMAAARERGSIFLISDLKMWNVVIGVVVWSLTYLLLLKSKRFNNKETVSRVLAVLHSFLASRCVEIFVLDFPFQFRKFGQVSGLYALIEKNFTGIFISQVDTIYKSGFVQLCFLVMLPVTCH